MKNFFCWLAKKPSRRLPCFYWPTRFEVVPRMTQMRWLDIHGLRDDVYTVGPVFPYKDNHQEYLKALADAVMSDPKGERTLMDWHLISSNYINPADTINRHPLDNIKNPDGSLTNFPGIWCESGIAHTKEKLLYLYSSLKSHGLELDYLTTQHEWSLTSWAMSAEHMMALEQDPRWPAFAQRLGFSSLEGVRNFFASQENRNQLSRFNAELTYQTAAILKEAVYDVIQSVWPKIKILDYSHYAIYPEHACWDVNGWPMNFSYRGNPWPGQCSDLNYMASGQMAQNEWLVPEVMRPWGDSQWHRFLQSVNQLRAIRNSAEKTPVHPEFCGWKIAQEWNIDWNTYKEHVFHCALTDVDALQWWLIQEGDSLVIDQLMAELDPILNGERSHSGQYPIDWHPDELRTTLFVDGKPISRVTGRDMIGRWER